MSNKVAEIRNKMNRDSGAEWITTLWDKYNNQRQGWIEEKKELRDYIFATDTSTTSNSSLPWKNSTTIPKLCQIRDNLYSNYKSALFPSDNWLKWQAHSPEAAYKDKRNAIETYMKNRVANSSFEQVSDQLLYDYIDYGNAFATASFEIRYKELDEELIRNFVGAKMERISPLDIVFNPLAPSFEESHKIVRSVKSVGELKRAALNSPEMKFWEKALDGREKIKNLTGGYSKEDFDKAVGFQADGFGSMYEYFCGEYIEILEFYGDYYDPEEDKLYLDRVVTIADRSTVIRNEPIPRWTEGGPIRHVGWRYRTDNLWAMGPLDNLVGLQYRLDHLENLKADAMDLAIHPPLKVIGEVEEFTWRPGAQIVIDEGGDVQELGKNLNGVMAAASEMAAIEDRMELYAGAPREAAGIRTPGEKTLGEVMQLATAAGRIFQVKTTQFEKLLLEPILNDMLEISRKFLDGTQLVVEVDKETGFEKFLSITREDIVADGIVRPIGARHFAKQAQDLQNLMTVFNSPIGQMIAPHTSAKQMSEFVNDITGLEAYNIFSPNAAVYEQQELQRTANNVQDEAIAEESQETII